MLASGLSAAHAQSAGGTTTTTAPPTGPPVTTSTTVPSGPAPRPGRVLAPPPAPAEVADHDSVVEPAPTEPVVIPPPPGAAAPPTPEAQQAALAAQAERQRELDRMVAARNAALAAFEALRRQTADLEARLVAALAHRHNQEGRLGQARERLKRLAVARYVATPVAPVNNTLQAPSFVDLSRRVAMVRAAVTADQGRVVEYQAAAGAVTAEVERLSAEVARSRAELARAATAMQHGDAATLATKAQLVAAQTGGKVVAGGMAFPVAGPHSFTDTFGAPRMFGTAFAHLHQGTDVFAPEGTPLVAIERGVLVRVGTDVLGGTKLWLAGATGTRYFYAHLSAFAPGVAEGKPVEAGEVIGFVGNTGNARGTSPHLHFEVHPGGGAAINPYPLLRLVAEETRRLVPTPLPGVPAGG